MYFKRRKMWRAFITSINNCSHITLHLLRWKFYTDNTHRMRCFLKDFALNNIPHNFRADNNRYQITETISLLLTAFKHYGTFFFITRYLFLSFVSMADKKNKVYCLLNGSYLVTAATPRLNDEENVP